MSWSLHTQRLALWGDPGTTEAPHTVRRARGQWLDFGTATVRAAALALSPTRLLAYRVSHPTVLSSTASLLATWGVRQRRGFWRVTTTHPHDTSARRPLTEPKDSLSPILQMGKLSPGNVSNLSKW